MYYPLAVLGIALIVVAILVYFVIPKMQEIYDALLEASGSKLPFLTRVLLAVAHFASSIAGIALLVVLVLAIASLIRWAKGPGKETVQRSSLTWPIAGPLIRQFNASYTVRSIGLLLDATDLNTALKLTAEARLNVVYGEMVEDIL